ncbi:leucine-rich repeat-containing protein 4C [Galendromus occidentalis]|uniref:Leucine-rich repeat-containing protein 4C n=1 Tax=Galendromus occidentalis TaxID=34638 RepID=A0AAJ6QX89_9ACAR|nr:leucine-rich repeat-containing protein 4C [Galendromus occidentalis]
MRVLVLVTAILASAVTLPVSDDYAASRTVCPSFMINCECTTTTTGVLVSCKNFRDRSQLVSTMHDLKGYNLHQFTMMHSNLDIKNGDFDEVKLFNMDVESSNFTARDSFPTGNESNLRVLKFQNSDLDFGHSVAVKGTKLSTLWFNRCRFHRDPTGWFEGLWVQWLRIENCAEMNDFIAANLGGLEKYSHIGSNLASLDRDMLPENSESITELDFSSNMISAISDDFLEGLTNLQRLDLSNNRLETLNEAIFKNFGNRSQLILSNNPLKCSPNLLWLARRLIDGSLLQAHRYVCINEDGSRQSIRSLASSTQSSFLDVEEMIEMFPKPEMLGETFMGIRNTENEDSSRLDIPRNVRILFEDPIL